MASCITTTLLILLLFSLAIIIIAVDDGSKVDSVSEEEIPIPTTETGGEGCDDEEEEYPLALLPKIEIVPLDPSQVSPKSADGTVSGWSSCGGAGLLLNIRVDGCEPSRVCTLTSGAAHYTEVSFVPSETSAELGMRGILVEGGDTNEGTLTKTLLLERKVPNSAVLGGKYYQVREDGGVSDVFRGKTIRVQHVLFRVADNVTETCADAQYRFL